MKQPGTLLGCVVAPLGALLAVCLAACGGAPPERIVVGTLERDRVELTAESNDPIVEIGVREGDHVAPGDVLLRQDDRRLGAAVARAVARRDGARNVLETARRELRRIRELASRRVESDSRLDDLLSAFHVAESSLLVAQAELDDAEIRRERLTVRAPSRAIVDALPFERGERPPPGAVVVILLNEGTPYARVYVPADLRNDVRPGTRAWVSIDGVEDPLPGRVRTVSREASFTPYFALTEHDRTRLSYVAEVDLEGATDLPTGVPVEVRFSVGTDVANRDEGDER